MQFLVKLGSDAARPPTLGGLNCVAHSAGVAIFGGKDLKVEHFDDLTIIGKTYPAQYLDERNAPCRFSFDRIIDERWGTYVALRFNQRINRLDVLTDPSALVPCYYVADRNTATVGSDAAAVLRASGTPIEIDWDEVALQLLRRDWRGIRCSLKHLREVPAGAIVRVLGEPQPTVYLWSPAKCLRRTRLLTFDEAVQRIRSVVGYCVEQLIVGSGRMLAGVSGGLDSSIIAACLKQSGADFECFTMFDEGGDADERFYARTLANHLGVRLTERPYRVDDVELEKSSVAILPRPVGWPFQQSLDCACREVLRETGATAVIRGTGGDAVFCYNNSASPIVDAFLELGPMAAANTCLDLSKLTGAGVGQCLKAAGRAVFRHRRPVIRVDGSLLSKDAISLPGASLRHFWLTEGTDLPPGRQRQIDMLCAPHNALEARLALSPSILCPLLCQPVMETCIKIPAWEWMRGGINRAPARQAFADLLPALIVNRTSKGGPGSFAARLYVANRAKIRELLMDGTLAARGIVDRTAVDRETRSLGPDSPKELLRLLALLDAEAWANHWVGLARA